VRAGALVVAAVLGTAGCGTGGPARRAAVAPHGSLLVGNAGGVAGLDASTGAVNYSMSGAVAAPDGSALLRTENGPDGPRLTALNPGDGTFRWSRDIPAGLGVRLVAPGGTHVVLMPPEQTRGGRARTTIGVLRGSGGQVESNDLEGNYEPEAFSTDGRDLFVIEYSPPLAPDRYRVRRLHLATWTVEDVYSPDKDLQQDMRGTAHNQIMSPDGNRLYTLYTLLIGDTPRAFVHTLDLRDRWAHCIDLPAGVGVGPEGTTTLAVAPDSKHVYVVDSAAHTSIAVHVQSISHLGRHRQAPLDVSGPVVASATADRLYVAEATGRMTVVRTDTLAVERRWTTPAAVTALNPDRTGLVYLGAPGRVDIVDGVTGRAVGRLDLPFADRITFLGTLVPGPDPNKTGGINCAC
jgi:hypothetical protein